MKGEGLMTCLGGGRPGGLVNVLLGEDGGLGSRRGCFKGMLEGSKSSPEGRLFAAITC